MKRQHTPTGGQQPRFSLRAARLCLAGALTLTLMTPAVFASTAALAIDGPGVESVEVDTPSVELVEITEQAETPEPESLPPVDSILPAEQAERGETPRTEPSPPVERVEQVEPTAPASSDAPGAAAQSNAAPAAPALPENLGGSAQLLPPNTARYLTIRLVDYNGEPVHNATVTLQGFGEHVLDLNGEVTFHAVPFSTRAFSVHPSTNARPDLQGYNGQVVVAQSEQTVTITLDEKPGASATGFHGRVTDSVSGEPLAHSTIWFEPVDRSTPRVTAEARSDGMYWITGLQNKPYVVFAQSYGWKSQNLSFTLTPSASYPRHDFALVPNRNVVSGLITDRDGHAIAGTTLDLIDSVTGAAVSSREVRSGGQYQVYFDEFNTPPGTYYFRVTPPALADLAPTYYPGVASIADAVAIDASDGQLAKRIDIALLGTQLSAVDDEYYTAANADITVTSPTEGLLDNDDGYRSIRVSGIQGVVNANSPSITRTTDRGGEVEVFTDGTFVYSPATDFEGVDSFTYMLRDEGPIAVATATVRITVGDGNDNDDPTPIVLRDDSYTTPYGTLLDVTGDCDALGIGANDDGDIRDFVLYDNAKHGSLDLEDKGCFTYLPDAGFSGTDTFVYTVTDDNGDPTGLTAPVTITVGEEDVDPDAPVANDDEYRVKAGLSFIMPEASDGLLANDTGRSALTVYAVLGDPLVPGFEIFTNGGNILRVSGNGTFTFVPRAGFTGNDDVTYTVIDEDGLVSQPATARFIVSDASTNTDDEDGSDNGGSEGNSGSTGTSGAGESGATGTVDVLATTGVPLQLGPALLAIIAAAVGSILLILRRRQNQGR